MVRVFRTPRQDTKKAPGYSGSGSSQHSRQSAHGAPKLGEGRRTNGRLIREQSRALEKLKFRASIENDTVRLAKVNKDIGIKTAFLSKLTAAYHDEHPNEEEITTIPGEDNLRPEALWFGPDTRRK